jgi:hypothetical protein
MPEADRCDLRLFELVRESAVDMVVREATVEDIEIEENEELRECECGRWWSKSSSSESDSELIEPGSDRSRSEPLSPTKYNEHLNCADPAKLESKV